MATDGLLSATADDLLALVLNGTTYSGPKGPLFVQLHIGAPGVSGTANVSSQTTRASSGPFSGSGGIWTNDDEIGDSEWTSHPANESLTDVSLWTASTAGACVATGTINAGNSVGIGAPVTIAPSGLIVSFNIASA